MNKIIRFLGLKGSWRWACRQMAKGHRVRRSSDGAVCYRRVEGGQRRVVWSCSTNVTQGGWLNAVMYLADFEATDWEVVGDETI